MKYKIASLKSKKIVGIEVRTSNQDGQAAKDIPVLWERFHKEGIKEKIADKVSETVYGLYTKYEGDHTQPYSLIVGCEVNSTPVELAEGCTVYETEASSYACIPAVGDFPTGVIQAWEQVWNSDLKRTFTTDLEVYDETFNPTSGSSSGITLYIAVK
jgi:predicted transcriptional regulator YdeE